MLTVERLKESFTYQPDTGLFIRNKKGNKPIGHISGVVDPTTGYVKLGVGNKVFHAHRLAVLYMTGTYPVKEIEIDHINRIKDDNRWENLRITTSSGNNMNMPKRIDNSTGITGITFTKNSYWARIQLNNKQISLGRFKTLEEATRVRREAEIKYGFLPNHGM